MHPAITLLPSTSPDFMGVRSSQQPVVTSCDNASHYFDVGPTLISRETGEGAAGVTSATKPAPSSYTCHRAERAAGFRHGNGVRKVRQDWTVGEVVNVGFVRGLTVVSRDADGTFNLVTAKGVRYGFQPHGGLFRADGFVTGAAA